MKRRRHTPELDEHTREALAIQVERRIDAALRDWCRFNQAGTSYIEPGSPWQNPYLGSFGGRLRDELLAIEAFTTLLEAQVLVGDWRIEYTTLRPHSVLGYLTPTDHAKAWTATHPALS